MWLKVNFGAVLELGGRKSGWEGGDFLKREHTASAGHEVRTIASGLRTNTIQTPETELGRRKSYPTMR
jgi:hypothetical protein